MKTTVDQDLNTRRLVEHELTWCPQVTDAAQIGVAIHHGVATLTGTVPTYSQKVEAGKAALRTRGVTALANDIDVVWGSRMTMPPSLSGYATH
ncbi:BON domain-containing protein [Nocardioides nematodiphilus]|uniref:BON domain-containing protein n=1 Tax=Nocardioides nematodiphilus TaxID=2849669 RepID=UPI001CD9A564|nr:BON domain-containing protein [Nocardioides nematodiphilus]